MRWLVGGLLAAVLVVGLIFAVTNLGSLFKSSPQPARRRHRPPPAPRNQSTGAAVVDRQPGTRGGAARHRRRDATRQLRFRRNVRLRPGQDF